MVSRKENAFSVANGRKATIHRLSGELRIEENDDGY